MSKRGALYIYWGNKFDDELAASVASAERFGLPVHVKRLERSPGLSVKAYMYDFTPFEETVYLDTDTLILDDLTFGLDMAAHHGLAISLAPACYARRGGAGLPAEAVEYNTGVIFFRKEYAVAQLFELWKDYAGTYPSNDQTSFARAISELRFNPFVLPPNWNLRAHLRIRPIFGPIKVWHSRMSLPDNIESWNRKSDLEFGEIREDKGRVRVGPVWERKRSLLGRLFGGG